MGRNSALHGNVANPPIDPDLQRVGFGVADQPSPVDRNGWMLKSGGQRRFGGRLWADLGFGVA